MISNNVLFSWQGINAKGQTLLGRNFAKSDTELKYLLYKQKIIAQKITKQTARFITLRRWLLNKQTLFFLTQVNALLKTGLNLNKTVKILNENQTEPLLTELLACLNHQLANGEKLSTVLSMFPILFDQITVQLIKSGEKSGQLENAIQQAAVYLDQKQSSTHQLLTALLYPFMLIMVSIIVLATLVMFVIPQFESIYAQSEQQLPLITVSILRISDGIKEHSLWLLIFILCLSFGFIFLKKHYHLQITKFIPKINKTVNKINTLRFCQTLAGLYQSGLSITDCLEACCELSSDNDYQAAIKQTISQIKKGRGLANAMQSTGYFDHLLIQLIKTGEESASLAQMLDQCSHYFDSQLKDNLNRIKILLEPLLIVSLGAIIGFILIAMYLPVFNLGSSF